ncbi:MAG: porin [Pirellulales bacterium]|nr:porin [Pirellulales bacterium]
MKIPRYMIPLVVLASLSTATAWAYDSLGYLLQPPSASPSDRPADPVLADPVAPTPSKAPVNDLDLSSEYSKEYESGYDGYDPGPSLGGSPSEPRTIWQPYILQNLGIKMGGWLEQGITFNGDSPASRFNGPVATNDLDNEYQMNQLWLYLTRPADNEGYGWAIGGHVDMTYGTDWRFGINRGLEDRINGLNGQTYGLVIPQAYLEIAYNNLSVKLGHFAAILDYEVVPAIFNPFYSHSYSYGYTVPQLVTGVLANYQLNDQWSVQAGFTRGWSMFEDNNNDMDFMGGFKWLSDDERSSLAYAISSGPQDPAGEENRFVHSFVATHKFTEKFEYVFIQNLGLEEVPNAADDAEWYGINQYFLYTINPCWQANLRVEWLRDDDGVRIAGPGNIPGVRAWDGRGFAGHFYEVTAGLTWQPHPNVIFRPEVRYDWYDGLAGPTGLPFDDGTRDDQFLFGMDLILTY